MKKIYLLAAFVSAATVYSQCNISGNFTMKVGESLTLSFDNNNAQCNDCHQWTAVGGNAEIEGDFRKNSIRLKANSPGRTVVSLGVLNSQGYAQCSKNIDVVDSATGSLANAGNSTKNVDCNIIVDGFKEVKYADGIVSFFPNPVNNDFKYTWTAVYANGKEAQSSEKVPQFNYSADNSISTVKVQIVSNKCIKNLAKTYDGSYWKFF